MRDAYGLGSFTSATNPSYNSSNPASGPTNYTSNYGVSFAGIKGDGTGQTIAIVDAGSDPDIATDLQTFDAYYGLPNPPSFQQLSQTGSSTNLPPVDSGWPGEISLDVEWSHVMAPGANIILFAASDLYTAVQYAATYPGVAVVSMSFTVSGTAPDSDFTTPSGHTGVSFFAGNGDTGAEVPSPAQSVNVVAVGGTALNLTGSGGYSSESTWSAGGGGISGSESQPAWQNGIVSTYSTTQRTTPDVSMDADPNTGVAIVDSYVRDIRSLGVSGAQKVKACTLHSECFRILGKNAVITITGRHPRPLAAFELEPMLADLRGAASGRDKKEMRRLVGAYEAAWARLQHEHPGSARSADDQTFEDALVSWLKFHRAMLIGGLVPFAYKYLRDNPAAPELAA